MNAVELTERVCNWGRWGQDDELGTLNHISAESRLAAAALVERGQTLSLAIPIEPRAQQPSLPGRFPPVHVVNACRVPLDEDAAIRYSDDFIVMPLQHRTQWDALAHFERAGLAYNGRRAADAVSERGALRCGIEQPARHGVVGRGVLLDLARALGQDVLDVGHVVTPSDLDRAVARAGLDLRSGDIVMIRTGHVRRLLSSGADASYFRAAPGLAPECLLWLHERSCAAVCADTHAVDRVPHVDSSLPYPLHSIGIVHMGLLLGEMFYLEQLAEFAARDGKYDCLLAAPPIGIVGAFGAPVNPVALR